MDIKFCQNGWFKYYIDSSNIHHILIELNGEITHVKSKSSLYSIFNSVNQSKTIQENEAYIKLIALRNNNIDNEEIKEEIKPSIKIKQEKEDKNISKEDIISNYKELIKNNNQKISRNEYRKIGKYPTRLIENLFGSWTNFMKEIENEQLTSQLDFELE